MACCMAGKYGCTEKVVYKDLEDKEYCIFHAPAEHKYVEPYVESRGKRPALISEEKFNKLVFARIQAVIDAGKDEERDEYGKKDDLDRTEFVSSVDLNLEFTMEEKDTLDYHDSKKWDPRCNFSGTIFHTKINFSRFNENFPLPPINFSDCIFTEEVNFAGSCFKNLFFFTDTIFEKKLCFSSKCELGAYFLGTVFKRKADFRDIEVTGSANFSNAQFCSLAWFHGSQLHGKAIFKESIFAEKSDFIKSHFHKETNFTGSRFEKETFFISSDFYHEASFEGSTFKKGAQFSDTKFLFANFDQITTEKNISFDFCKFEGSASIKNFTGKKPGGIHFFECEFYQAVNHTAKSNPTGTEIKECIFHKKFEHHCIEPTRLVIDHSQFNDLTNFSNSDFSKLTISNSDFNKQALFKDITTDESISICNCHFKMMVNFNKANFQNQGTLSINNTIFDSWVYFRDVTFSGEISFEDTICERYILIEGKDVDLSKMAFSKINIESFKFIGCKWGKNRFDPVYDEVNKAEPSELEEIYRRLKSLALNSYDQVQASAWHYKEKEMQTKRLAPKPFYYFYLLLYLFIGTLAWVMVPIPHNYYFIGLLSPYITLLFLIYFRCEKPISFNAEFKKLYIQTYYCISGYGEKPLWALLWLGILILTPIIFYGAAYISGKPEIVDYSRYIPLMGNKNQEYSFLQATWQLLITLQATLFAFALRNKLRR